MAGRVASNLTRLAALLRSLPAALAFDAPGEGENLGYRLARRAFAGVRRRSIDRQVSPTGSRWAPNEPRYAASKGGRAVGVGLTGEMLSVEQLMGEFELTPTRVRFRYGKDARNRQKAAWFQQGVRARRGTTGRWRQPPRYFYDLDPEIVRDLETESRAVLRDRVEALRRRT
jgi:hypothetical protein